MSKIGPLALFFLSLFIAPACSCFHEVFHFKAVGLSHTNYYRVTLKGWTAFSSSQFAAGVYDAEAVDALFGELKGSTIEAFSSPANSGSGASTGDTRNKVEILSRQPADIPVPSASLRSLDGARAMDDRKLVFFLSANSDAVVGRIKSFVNTREVQQSVVNLILKDDRAELELARVRARPADARAGAVAAELRALVTAIEGNASFDAKKANDAVRKLMSTLARHSTEGTSDLAFANAAEAREWEQKNPLAFFPERGTSR